MAYRNARHRILDKNPSFLVYGRDPVMPYHLIFSEKERSYSGSPSYAQQLVTKLQSAFALVKQNLDKHSESYSKVQVSLPKNKRIVIGDLVYAHTRKIKAHTSKKLPKLNQGPYRVMRQNSSVIFQIQHISHPLDIQTIHLNRLVKVMEREIFPTIEEKSEIVDSPVDTNETNQSLDDTNVSEEFPHLSLPYKSLVNDINLSLRSVTRNTSVDQTQIDDDSVSYDIPVSPNFSSSATSIYDYPDPSTPVSMSNVNTNVSQIQSRGSIVQNTHLYNLRPRDIYDMVIYNKH
ncbi:hypothetical protein AVEN_137571-1 [Araneus ventricosus]|uniref:Integrase p58-like C-terminal domain-containing protein n=1 Tax=Araneus ventricosus TaxID=182803 RepID=A0A4Y2KXL9_ARAVE|nr:hypothetical protein AVEN_137571-1 [Araneus ventricosus]